MDRKARRPRVDYPPVRVYRCDAGRLHEDVIRIRIEGVEVVLTNIPRTVADCFKHRRVAGFDVAIEALRDVVGRRLCTPSELVEAARRARVWNLMRPYLEALL
jgi:predicted transcriptional regulator of viral defense system